jgi:presenilin-like A22 family membrane protease
VYISYWVLSVIAPDALTPSVGGNPVDVIAIGGALLVGAALVVHPEWYVIDATGILMGIGAAGLFGINFGLLPALVLLVALAVYDAISVYGTEHMLTLASGVMDMHVPVVFVVPLSLSYSFLDSDPPAVDDETDEQALDDPAAEELNDLGPAGIEALDNATIAAIDEETIEALDDDVRETLEEERERDALFIGLGDAVIPTVLVASAAFFIESGPGVTVFGVTAPLPALTAIVGTTAGLLILLWMVLKGRAHAGLPLLNGGAIAGYLLGALVSGLTLAETVGISGGVF